MSGKLRCMIGKLRQQLQLCAISMKKTKFSTCKRRKRGDLGTNEFTQTSSNIKNTKKPDASYSTYDWHYIKTLYVDETLLMKAMFAIHHTLITAPSRFGKSLNMDLVRRFVEIELDEKGDPIELNVDKDTDYLKEEQLQPENYKLFQGKKISYGMEIMY
ncbi:hypothetical protein PV328_000336 [Microctonus aethiopoides]|uniref:AAA-ATPase-like domain-containing protein n=1 Tax=Microctonus aethiopoides TaxID=144406 RepID=A0AA39FUP5_9HYME|nr:hypothetical protein PV328_000336 [Microctonus aethiopoides]